MTVHSWWMLGFFLSLTALSSRHLWSATLVFKGTCVSPPSASLNALIYASMRSEHGAGLYALLSFVILRSRRVILVARLRTPPILFRDSSHGWNFLLSFSLSHEIALEGFVLTTKLSSERRLCVVAGPCEHASDQWSVIRDPISDRGRRKKVTKIWKKLFTVL